MKPTVDPGTVRLRDVELLFGRAADVVGMDGVAADGDQQTLRDRAVGHEICRLTR